MPDMTGLQLIEKLRYEQPGIQSIVVSAYSDFEMAREAIRLAAVYYILKPFSEEEFQKAVCLIKKKLNKPLATLEIDEKYPAFPDLEGKNRHCYLLLADTPERLPTKENHENNSAKPNPERIYWQPIRIGEWFGILTDFIPEKLPEGCGASISFPDFTDADRMLQMAKASLNGAFHFANPGLRETQVCAADLQLYLYEHLSEDISLGRLANHFFITETYLCDLFKKQTGETVLGFLRKLRINRSKKMLKESRLPLSEIALQCGYKDYSYFGKHFKAEVGTTPELFRNG
jgi:two-component system response regulator YesN